MAMLTVTCSFAACGKDADTVNDQVTADVTADDNAAGRYCNRSGRRCAG